MERYETAGQIINDALVEVGLEQSIDAFTSVDPAIRQMALLLTSCGRQLVTLFGWQSFQREHTIVTAPGDTGKYDLPDDFDHLIDISGWSRTQRVKLPGSISPQQWQYLKGRNLVSSTIYLVFREVENQFWVYPQPPDAAVPSGLTIAFEYVSKGWVKDGSTYKNRAEKVTELVQYNPYLISRLLKLRFREARGMDATAAQQEFLQAFSSITGQDVANDTLNAANMSQPYPYIDMWRNTPDTGYGM